MAPGTRIAHHFELIAQLEQDHRDLLRIYSGLRRASDAGRMQEAGEQLETFRHALQGHLLKENVKLYVYLEHTLAADATSHELMHGFRHEMDRIGKAVMVFLDRYRDLAGHPEWKDDFARELDGIGKVLVERMRNEESNLYPLRPALSVPRPRPARRPWGARRLGAALRALSAAGGPRNTPAV
jgi:regulator of sigma D